MDYQGLFLLAQFLNERKKASRKEISEFLSRKTGASQSKTDALLSVIANSPKIQALPQEKRMVLKTARGIYEISKAGEKLLKSKNTRRNFEAWIDGIYGETATQKFTCNQNQKIPKNHHRSRHPRAKRQDDRRSNQKADRSDKIARAKTYEKTQNFE